MPTKCEGYISKINNRCYTDTRFPICGCATQCTANYHLFGWQQPIPHSLSILLHLHPSCANLICCEDIHVYGNFAVFFSGQLLRRISLFFPFVRVHHIFFNLIEITFVLNYQEENVDEFEQKKTLSWNFAKKKVNKIGWTALTVHRIEVFNE